MLKSLVAKAMTPITILLEAYRIFNGTLLVIFVPGVCGDKACLPQQNFANGSTLYKVNCGVNLLALVIFIGLYAIEIQREYKLYAYLRMNPEKPSDAITVKAAFESLTVERKNFRKKKQRLDFILVAIHSPSLKSVFDHSSKHKSEN